MNDITVTILENGTCRIDTDQISGPAHQAAESALQWIARELGGEVTRTKKVTIGIQLHGHDHDHDHFHTHN